ncbi:SCAR3-like isoform X1 [Olea europaea subsp. europaea]|uniref:SCAR3-like isoform X1 n=1 Tax=Olea europaea subsp. europaea TaxID=158383 RepID=A0A8S0PTB0_OLEEU|nr:SCAR3-like isoform X1 [Olea europaea subsp. europaea]
MPSVRVEIRNEYGLGALELYREANKEDPKEVLDGIAVAGLVGILRQLGYLAEFTAEVFHGLQGELMITSRSSHKLMARLQRIEAALSPVENAVLAQRSHLHYAYIAGTASICFDISSPLCFWVRVDSLFPFQAPFGLLNCKNRKATPARIQFDLNC